MGSCEGGVGRAHCWARGAGVETGRSPHLDGAGATTEQLAAPASGASFERSHLRWLGPRPSLCRVNGASRTQKRSWPQQPFVASVAPPSPRAEQVSLQLHAGFSSQAQEACRCPARRGLPQTEVPALVPSAEQLGLHPFPTSRPETVHNVTSCFYGTHPGTSLPFLLASPGAIWGGETGTVPRTGVPWRRVAPTETSTACGPSFCLNSFPKQCFWESPSPGLLSPVLHTCVHTHARTCTRLGEHTLTRTPAETDPLRARKLAYRLGQ